MPRSIGSALLVLLLFVVPLGSQARSEPVLPVERVQPAAKPLDDVAVGQAIDAIGSGPVPLELHDRGGLFSGAGGGYRITIYTPQTWVTHLARQAATVGTALTVADVAPADRAPVLRVLASPSAPTIGASRAQSSAVLRVLVLDEGRRSELLAEHAESFAARHRVILGSARALNGIEATFHLGAFDVLRGGAGQEFFVRIEGTGYTKDFKIKRKHFDQLPL